MGRFAMFDLIYNYKHYHLDRIPKGLLEQFIVKVRKP